MNKQTVTALFAAALLACHTLGVGHAQSQSDVQKPTVQNRTATDPASTPGTHTEPAVQTVKPALGFGMADGTPIKLILKQNMSSGDANLNDRVLFEAAEDVMIDGVKVIAKGAQATGTVTEVKRKGRMGRAGKLHVKIDDVHLTSGERVALRAAQGGKGDGRAGAMTGAMVATGIVFFPAAPLFLMMRGKNIKIPAGTLITAYVDGDAKLDRGNFTSVVAQ